MTRMAALTDFQPTAFADCLERLREDAHLTQRGLARLSDVSHTAISGLERGDAPPPHPSQLHKIATGLSTSGSGHVDERRRDELYLTLMRAAGYLPAVPGPSPDVLFREQLAHYLGQTAPEMQYLLGKLRGRSEKTRQAAIRVLGILADNE